MHIWRDRVKSHQYRYQYFSGNHNQTRTFQRDREIAREKMSRKKRVSFSNWARKVQQSEWLWAEQETLSITASESLNAEENITSREIFACCIGTKTFYTFIFNGLHSIPPFGCTGRVWIINASTQHKVFAYISAQKNSFQCVCVFFMTQSNTNAQLI